MDINNIRGYQESKGSWRWGLKLGYTIYARKIRMIRRLIGDDNSITPPNNQNYKTENEGDRWRRIRCGRCCDADFEDE